MSIEDSDRFAHSIHATTQDMNAHRGCRVGKSGDLEGNSLPGYHVGATKFQAREYNSSLEGLLM